MKISPPDMLALDAPMQGFIADAVRDERSSSLRFRRLLQALQVHGYLAAEYDAGSTLTAAETFRTRRGNCLSYTNMFVALARAAGLRASYQLVDVPANLERRR